MKQTIDENAVKNQIIQYLTLTGWLVLRINSGATVGEEKGKRRFVNFVRWFVGGCNSQTAGVSDILAFRDGLYLAVECKRPGKSANVSEWQKKFLEEWAAHGGLWCVAESIDDVIKVI